MPIKTKSKPKTKTKTPLYNRRTATKQRKHRSWIWWTLVLVPIAISVWLFAEPLMDKADAVLKTTSVERAARSTANREAYSKPQSEIKGESVLDESVKDDVDWALSHVYKLLPILISLIVVLKKGAIMGRAN